MIAIDLPEEQRAFGDSVAAQFPDGICVIDGRAIDGTMTHFTLFISAAAVLLPQVRKIIAEVLQAKRHKSVTLKGVKFQGYSAGEIKDILAALDGPANKK